MLLLEFGKSWIFSIFCPGKSPTFLRACGQSPPLHATLFALSLKRRRAAGGRVFPSLDAQLFMREYSRHHRQGKTLFFHFLSYPFFALLRGFPPSDFGIQRLFSTSGQKRGGMEGKGTPFFPFPLPCQLLPPAGGGGGKNFHV